MKILKYLSTACLLLGMYACDEDEISVTPALSFKEKAVTVAENAGTLKVPVTLTAATSGSAVVYVTIKEGSATGGKEGAIYCNVPSYVVLEEGAVRGFVTLQIIDNEFPNADCSFDLEITKVEGGAKLDPTASTCRVTIVDDDSKHSVTVGFDTTYFSVNEDAGYAEIPVTVEGTLSGFMSFKVVSVDGTAVSSGANWDYKVTTSEVKLKEEEAWGVVRIDLNDGQALKEDRSFKLRITEVMGVNEADTTVGVRENVRECEVVIKKVVREATFADSLIVVAETMKPFDFSVKLTAPVDRDVTLTFQPKAGATAIEGTHFKLSTHQLTIKKGETTASATMTIIDEKYGNRNRFCDFEITETTGNVDVAVNAACRLVIENDDSSIAFGETLVVSQKARTVKVPIRLNGLHDKRVVLDLVGSMEGGVNEMDYYMILGKKLEIAVGDSVVYAEVQLMNPNVTTFFVRLKIDKITVDGLGVQVPLEQRRDVCNICVLPIPTASASSNAPVSGNEGAAEFLIDGNMDSYWHSQWGPDAPLPHWVQVDLGMEFNINNVEMWRRPGANNDIKTCTLQLSTDAITWDDIETYTFTEATDKYRIHIFSVTPRARYVRYYISESNRPPYAGIAEIKIAKTPILD